MSNLIQATPDELRNNASNFINHSGEVQGNINSADALTYQMEKIWNKPSSGAFTQESQVLKSTMNECIVLINKNIAVQVSSVIDALE